jgi:phytoene dehydrogenase-like protein
MNTPDAIIIGGGHNGLVCANYLARSGIKPLVLERRPVVGGAAVTEEIAPGFRASIFSYLMSILHPRIIAELELKRHGLEVMPCSDMLSPLDGGDYIVFSDNVARTQASFARFSQQDADIYPEFDRHLTETANVFRKMLWETPFDPTKRDMRTVKQVAGFLYRNHRYGNRLFQVADMLTMSAYDYLSKWFGDERIKAVLAYYACIGTFAGPKTPGSAYVIMHHVMGENAGAGGWGFIKGGMGQITQSLAAAAIEKGATIRTGVSVARIKHSNGRATGVVTADGEEIDARLIVSNAHAKLLYLDMIGAEHLPADTVRDMTAYKTFSTAFKMNIACERPPQYRCLPKAIADGALGTWSYPTYVHIAPDIDYLERAYDDARDGWYSAEPFVTPVVPTIVDKTLAPAGKHVVNLFGGHAPHRLKNGDWSLEKAKFRQNVLNVVERHAPGFQADIIADQFLVPEDIERIVGLPQGHIFHGELSPDQLFFKRPVAHYADYRTPLEGLWLCGASSHPGGGVSGIPGYNAAREILRDLGKRHALRYGTA